MRLAVVTPVGPGHERIVGRCQDSVRVALRQEHPWDTVQHIVVYDLDGQLGRGRARNIGMDCGADWLFFLDADDWMMPDALKRIDLDAPATFGAVAFNGKPTRANVYPCTREQVIEYGGKGTLSMGFFCRADIAQRLRFCEDMNAGEDFDFYMRLPEWTKQHVPLVEIGRFTPSARGPRGYKELDWHAVCRKVIDGYAELAV